MIARLRELRYTLIGQTRLLGGMCLQLAEDTFGIKIPATRFFLHSYSYFFRDTGDFEEALIRRYAEVKRELKVLCVGCARGQEPYTIAILCDKLGIPVSVTAVDRSPHAIGIAREGVYDLDLERSNARNSRGEAPVERIDAHLRWFEPAPGGHRIIAPIRARVNFEVMDAGDLPFDGDRDVVFARNMLYYLPPAKLEDVVRRLKRALAPGLGVESIITDPITKRKGLVR